MAPLTLDLDEPTTDTTGSEYDRWELVAYYAPEFRTVVDRELDRLSKLEPNWDAEGAVPIDPAIIVAARTMVCRLPENLASTPAVVPMRKGNLQFEWNDGRRSLELEIEDPGTIHYLKWDSGEGIEEEGLIPIDNIDGAVSLIRWFMGSVTHV